MIKDLGTYPKSYVYDQLRNKPRGNLYYLKYDADKVIAEKDKEIQRLENLCESYRIDCDNLAIREANAYKEIERDNKQIRHHKYKRCLSKANDWRSYATFCGMQSNCHNHRGFGKTADIYTWKEIHAWKCVKRYKELAEKFKHNNEVNNV